MSDQNSTGKPVSSYRVNDSIEHGTFSDSGYEGLFREFEEGMQQRVSEVKRDINRERFNHPVSFVKSFFKK